MPKPRILIADDHALMAEGLSSLLSKDYEIIGIASDGRQLVSDAVATRPDIIVLDIGMPELNGLEAAIQLKKTPVEAKLVFVTQQTDLQYLKAAFRAGALAYVVKQSASEELRLAIKSVLEGKMYITPLLKKSLPKNISLHDLQSPSDVLFKDLTPRQREVLQLVAEGKTVKEISAILKISPKTVEFHKSALMNEVGLRTTADLTRYALAHGVIVHP